MPSFLDADAILLATTSIRLVVALGLVLYARSQQTCPGFRQWVLGTTVSAVSRAGLLMTSLFPAASLLLNVQLQSLAILLLLDGTCRYLGLRRLDRRLYTLPALGLPLTWALSTRFPPEQVTSLWAVAAVGTLALAGGLLWLRPASPTGRTLRWTASGIHFAFVALLAWRASSAGGPDDWRSAFYLLGGILDMMTLALFVMLDGRYVEDQLQASRERLEGTFQDLQQSLARVRLLFGILPTCSGCRKIRDEQERWIPLEDYVAVRAKVRISTHVCPDCREASA